VADGLQSLCAVDRDRLVGCVGVDVRFFIIVGVLLSMDVCAIAPSPEDAYQPLSALAAPSGYSVDYLGWLVRRGRIEAVKRGGHWHSTPEAIARYKAEVTAGTAPRGRPKMTRT